MTGIISTAKKVALSRISAIVITKKRQPISGATRENRTNANFSDLLDRVVEPEEIISLDVESLTKRVRGIMAVELVSGMLDDLTPEQMEMFEAAVEKRQDWQ